MISEAIQYSANTLLDPSRADMKGAKHLAKDGLCHSTFNWRVRVILKQPEIWKGIREFPKSKLMSHVNTYKSGIMEREKV